MMIHRHTALKTASKWMLLVALLSGGKLMAQESAVALYQTEPSAALDQTYLQAAIPTDTYRYARSPMLKDIVVIDQSGAELPSQILPMAKTRDDGQQAASLNFFSVVKGTALSQEWLQGQTQLQINDGAIAISVNPNDNKTTKGQHFYLIDLREQPSALQQLILTWEATPASQFVEVEVWGSNDLNHWESVANKALVNVQKEEQRLLQNRLETNLKAQQYDYLRIDFPQRSNIVVTDIQGELSQPALETPQISWRAQGVLADQQVSVSNDLEQVAAWEFTRDDSASIEHVGLNLGETAYGNNIRVYSRPIKDRDWRLRYSGVWFNAKVGGEWQQSEPAELVGTTDPLWRVELSPTVREQTTPMLTFYHPQQMVQFIASNNAPYYLAKTNTVPDIRASAVVFEQVLGQQQVAWSKVTWRAEETIVLPEQQERQRNWADIVFWISLVVAVLVLALFAIRLLRQLQHDND